MIKVTKFGGSSLADSTQFQKVKQIIEDDPNRRFIVVSACGKNATYPNKITDLLFLLHAHVKYHVDTTAIFDLIAQRFYQIKKDLHLTTPIEEELNQLKQSLSINVSLDELVSRGEYFTAKLMADYLNYPFLDASTIIQFQYDGTYDHENNQKRLEAYLANHSSFVMSGFYGSLPNGAIKIMSRGGGDVTGALLARYLHSDVYENFTDVDGILMADPNIVDHPKQIKTITYAELRELSYMGASVLHEEAIFPIMDQHIPIHILNTNNPKNEGTKIVDDKHPSDNSTFITGIAGRKDFLSVAVYKNHMSNEIGMIRKVLSIFERYHISIEHIPSGIDSFSVIVQKKDVENCLYDIISDIKKETGADRVDIVENIALIATVGKHMQKRSGTSGQLFATLGAKGINIKMIAQGSDEINIIVGVDNKDFETTIRVIYDTFVKQEQEKNSCIA